jgi:hypothetical protein
MTDNERKLYFNEKEEQAVLDYIMTNSKEEKNRIYNEILIEPFRKMKESILRKYPIHIGNYDMDEVESNALTHLIEHMVKYKPYTIKHKLKNDDDWSKISDEYKFFYYEDALETLKELRSNESEYEYKIFNAKAFSYCQTIIRNYYKDHGRKSYTEKMTNLSYDDYLEEIEHNTEYIYEIGNDYHDELQNLINVVIDRIEDKIDNDENIKNNEIIVGDAIINIFKNWHKLFMEESPDGKYQKKVTNKYEKNKILFFLKEQTGLTTKEIRIALKPFKDIYFEEKDDYLND